MPQDSTPNPPTRNDQEQQYSTLRLILGDQLNAGHSWFSQKDSSCLYVIAELKQETQYTRHHIQKVSAFFAAMQSFATALQQAGYHVLHLTLDDTAQHQQLSALIKSLCQQFQITRFEYQRPDEFRLLKQMQQLTIADVVIEQADTEHFLLPFEQIAEDFEPDQHQQMERFYRKMRKRFAILMDGEKPEGGKWNFDADNRQKLKKADLTQIPQPLIFSNDISAILDRLKRHQIETIGQTTNQLLWPISRAQSQSLLEYFCQYGLPLFGRFQDAMTSQHPHQWSLYHSRLSFALNSKMLHPMQVIQTAITAYRTSQGKINLAQIEGFVRQILGWREFVRAIYWRNMPDYAARNALDAQRDLPEFFWTGQTKMNCLKQAIQQSLDYAYAHHIQRLMITGNFCLLTEVHPDQVDNWYLGIYIDAIEWVEMPNTRGMSQFADGGIVATKPYCASGNYVQKMSDYCSTCVYQVKQKTGELACPLNSLYWRFMVKHRAKLSQNHRVGMLFSSWDKRAPEERDAILQHAEQALANIQQL